MNKKINVSESITQRDAYRLASTIEKYWRDRGRVVKCRVERQSLTSVTEIFVVRSDMGWYCPPRIAPPPAAARIKFVVHGI